MVEARSRGGSARITRSATSSLTVAPARNDRWSPPSCIAMRVTRTSGCSRSAGKALTRAETIAPVPPTSRMDAGSCRIVGKRRGASDRERSITTSPSECCAKAGSPRSSTTRAIRGCIAGQYQDGPRSKPSGERSPLASTDRMRPPKRFLASSSWNSIPRSVRSRAA